MDDASLARYSEEKNDSNNLDDEIWKEIFGMEGENDVDAQAINLRNEITPTSTKKRTIRIAFIIALFAVIMFAIIQNVGNIKFIIQNVGNIMGNQKTTTKVTIGTVKKDVANIRSGPSTGYPIIGRMKKGEKVDILPEEEAVAPEEEAVATEWYVIRYKGGKGYIYKELVDR
ncbi:MAG: SH3 domain-containing protein [bacterium]